MSREQTECGETQLDQAGRKIRRESAFDRWKDAWWQTPTEGLLSDTKRNQHAVPGRKNGHHTLAPCKCSPALLAYRACVRKRRCKSPDRPTRPRFLLALPVPSIPTGLPVREATMKRHNCGYEWSSSCRAPRWQAAAWLDYVDVECHFWAKTSR